MSTRSWEVVEKRLQIRRPDLEKITTLIFGDQLGVTLCLGALLFFGLFWRVGFFINDNYVVANTLVGVADGHLWIDRIVFGEPPGHYPGTYSVRGKLYGRNYGHIFVSLPVFWLLEGSSLVADPRILLTAVWSLGLLAFCRRVGVHVGQRMAFTALGVIGALVVFVANVAMATPLDPRWFPLFALQLTTMAAAALMGVVLYRLLAAMYTREVGLVAGATVVLASPIGFWATIPKRHVPVAFLAVCTLYCFYRSRSVSTVSKEVRFRALSYAFVGFSAWVYAPEALALLLALGPIDVLTARSNKPRHLAFVGVAFGLSLVPFVLTNLAISGNPFQPPSLVRKAGGIPLESAPQPSGGGGTSGVSSGANGSSGLFAPLFGLIAEIGSKSAFITDRFTGGTTVIANDPNRLVSVFLRSGRPDGVRYALEGQHTINLSLLEATPIVGVLLGAPAVMVSALRRSNWRQQLDVDVIATDLVVCLYVALLTLIYIPALPIHAQVTVRYLLPLAPLGVYGAFRLPAVRTVCNEASRLLGWSYIAGVLVGGQFTLLCFVWLQLTLGEAMQLHALIGLWFAVGVGLWALADSVMSGVRPQIGAILLGLTAAVTTIFLCFAGWAYFSVGDYAFPIVKMLTQALPIV